MLISYVNNHIYQINELIAPELENIPFNYLFINI